MKWHGFWEEIYVGSWCFFFSSVLCFLRGTSLKRARDDFPLHALVIIWEGEFIRGRKSPGAKKKEPHHGQGRIGALWKISTPRCHSNLWGNKLYFITQVEKLTLSRSSLILTSLEITRTWYLNRSETELRTNFRGWSESRALKRNIKILNESITLF